MKSRLDIEEQTETTDNIRDESQSRKKCVLFVENDPALFKVVDQMLKLLGYETVISANGKEACRLIESQPKRFDVVITDMNMPGMGGLELTKNILEVRPDIPVLLCTGLDTFEIGKKAREIGIRAIIPKPFMFKDLKQTISEALAEG